MRTRDIKIDTPVELLPVLSSLGHLKCEHRELGVPHHWEHLESIKKNLMVNLMWRCVAIGASSHRATGDSVRFGLWRRQSWWEQNDRNWSRNHRNRSYTEGSLAVLPVNSGRARYGVRGRQRRCWWSWGGAKWGIISHSHDNFSDCSVSSLWTQGKPRQKAN